MIASDVGTDDDSNECDVGEHPVILLPTLMTCMPIGTMKVSEHNLSMTWTLFTVKTSGKGAAHFASFCDFCCFCILLKKKLCSFVQIS